MRRQADSIAVSLAFATLAAGCGLTGCTREGSNPNDVVLVDRDQAGMLHEIRSASELESLLTRADATAMPAVMVEGHTSVFRNAPRRLGGTGSTDRDTHGR